MLRVPLWLAVILVSLAGCSSKSELERQRDANVSAAERETAASPLAALRRAAPLTRADREAWKKILQWPAACEEAFQASATTVRSPAHTADGGLAFHALGTGVTLAQVTCRTGTPVRAGGAGSGAGGGSGGASHSGPQSSQVFVRLDERGSSPEAFVLRFPVVHAPPGTSREKPSPAIETELTGVARISPDGRTLSLLTMASTSAECGTWTLYALAGEHPRIGAMSVEMPCPATSTDVPTSYDGNSPPGWRPLGIPR